VVLDARSFSRSEEIESEEEDSDDESTDEESSEEEESSVLLFVIADNSA